ncbi:MoaD/ThiS family protein [Ruegeria arenilitoris]|uniref:MoaD/ThiS family protein n=1 Tax=Ruegeria arenilitoris TaxID=1173585 RepID=UPI001481ACDE|nr:MoaD/ThiS family protein [Ruegeria arenilitoris]
MVEVHLWSGLRSLTGGKQVVEVEAATTGELLRALVRVYPQLQAPIDAGVSVAIDGRIIASGLSEAIPEGAEIYLMQRLRGG